MRLERLLRTNVQVSFRLLAGLATSTPPIAVGPVFSQQDNDHRCRSKIAEKVEHQSPTLLLIP
jgi:hypothetical protein